MPFSFSARLSGLAFTLALAATAAASQTGTGAPHPKIDPARVYRFPEQEVVVPDFPAADYILDLGGGGEGIIGRIKTRQVIAIDVNRRELAEAPPGPLKLVMDARDLQFLDASFATATAFYTLMYIAPVDHDKVFREVYRVLQPGGRFLIWDVQLSPATDPKKDIAVFRFRFRLPKEEVETGYGTFFPKETHDATYWAKVARAAGFEVTSRSKAERSFYMEVRKP